MKIKITFALLLALLSFVLMTYAKSSVQQDKTAQPTSPAVKPRATQVLLLLTVKPGITLPQIMKVMPAEIRATVRLYLDGKIQQWYSRGDGKGVVFILNTSDIAEARSIIEGLPLAKENLMDEQYIPIGPLMPLGTLLNSAAPPQ